MKGFDFDVTKEASIANSKQETQKIAEQIQAEFPEISTLSLQIVTGDDKDDKCNTRFIKEHKPSNHIRARIKSHVYTTE